MKINLKNKKALIGGSSKGLGYAVAKQLAVCGAEVTLVSRNESLLKKNIIELKELTGCNHNYLLVDYNNSKDYKKIIDDFFKTNTIDILINNTQGPPAGDVLSVSESDYEQTFNLLFQNTVHYLNIFCLINYLNFMVLCFAILYNKCYCCSVIV